VSAAPLDHLLDEFNGGRWTQPIAGRVAIHGERQDEHEVAVSVDASTEAERLGIVGREACSSDGHAVASLSFFSLKSTKSSPSSSSTAMPNHCLAKLALPAAQTSAA
jgi:hypothetical protein